MEHEVQNKKKKKLIILLGAVIIIAVTGLVIFLNSPEVESTNNAQLDGDLVSLRAGVSGYIKSIRYKDNQLVQKGDTLILFEADELKAKVQLAEAALENATANLQMMENRSLASTENAVASEKSAESNQQVVVAANAKLEKAQKDLDRITELLKIKGATVAQLEAAQSDLQVAKSDYSKAIHQEESSISTSHGIKAQSNADKNQIDLAKAQIKQREADLTLAQKQLSYAYVLAPCNGIATKRSVNIGQYTTVGQSICVLVNTDQYWVTANFKETQLRKIKIGNTVDITLDAYPDLKLSGKIESFGGATGAKFSLLPPDNATGNFIKITQRFPLRISIENFPKEKANEIFPGLSAFVSVKVGA